MKLGLTPCLQLEQFTPKTWNANRQFCLHPMNSWEKGQIIWASVSPPIWTCETRILKEVRNRPNPASRAQSTGTFSSLVFSQGVEWELQNEEFGGTTSQGAHGEKRPLKAVCRDCQPRQVGRRHSRSASNPRACRPTVVTRSKPGDTHNLRCRKRPHGGSSASSLELWFDEEGSFACLRSLVGAFPPPVH